MKPIQFTKLGEQIERGYKFLRAFEYDAKSKRLELTLGSDEGCTKFVIAAATEPTGLDKWIGNEIYGVRLYRHLHHTVLLIDLGPTITFVVDDEVETEPDREELEA